MKPDTVIRKFSVLYCASAHAKGFVLWICTRNRAVTVTRRLFTKLTKPITLTIAGASCLVLVPMIIVAFLSQCDMV